MQPLCNATVPCGQDPLILRGFESTCISSHSSETNQSKQSQVDQYHLSILVPQLQGERTDQPVPTAWVARIVTGFPACGTAILPQS